MVEVRLKNEVDPHRLTGKEFTRRKAFPRTHDDYCIIIDGLTAGRIMKKSSRLAKGHLVLDADRAVLSPVLNPITEMKRVLKRPETLSKRYFGNGMPGR